MKKFVFAISLFCCVLSFSQEQKSEDVIITEIDEDSAEIPFAIIEKVPIYKGCDENLGNRELKQCMSDGISKHVMQTFNINVAKGLGLPDGIVRVNVIFKINKEGEVIDIKTSAPHPDLEAEALRVVSLIPTLTKPGYQKGKPVVVPYALPIVFKIDSSKYSKKKRKGKL